MSKGPKGQKRPADVTGNAITFAKIATGEITEEQAEETPAESPAVQLGRLGGKVRARS